VSPGSPLVTALAQLIDWILVEFDTDLGVFAEALERLESIARDEAERRAAHLAEIEREAALKEALAVAEEQARTELGQRMDKETPAFLREFLYRWWTIALARWKVGAGDDGSAWADGLRAAEYLIWSVAPKHGEDVSRLATILPRMIRALNLGVSSIEMPREERDRFFDELLQAHTREIEAAKKRGGTSQPVRSKPSVRLESDGSVRFVDRRGEGARSDEVPTLAAAELLLQSLRRGQRVELADAAGAAKVYKLAWISPARKLFVLTRYPEPPLTFASSEFASLLDSERARLIADESAMDRMIEALTRDPAPTAASQPIPAELA
jgi:hypothetical protein